MCQRFNNLCPILCPLQNAVDFRFVQGHGQQKMSGSVSDLVISSAAFDKERRKTTSSRVKADFKSCKTFLTWLCECPPPYIFHVWFRLACGYRRSPIGFFNRVIPTHVFAQSRNPDGYYLHPRSRAYFQSRISPPFCFNIPESWQIPDPEKPIGESQYSRLSSPLYLVRRASERRLHSQAWFRERFFF